ncbi:MAG: filamentous hemagglutinin N-terminal domain-containing protein, partial [Lentisphaeria bacterium]
MDRLQMNQKMPWSARFLSIFLSGLMLATPFSVVAQLPTNPGVVHGDVNFNQQGLDLFINQSTGSAIVNWDSFSIGSGNGVHITQPGSKAAMLSRVLGEDPSVIQGLLEATGIVYLVNQNGIYFGPDSRIDAGAIVASTMDMDNDAFMAGRALFRGTPEADIINEGDITAEQFVAFLARNVRNSGHIRANAVTMAALEDVTFDTIYGGSLSVDVTGMVGDVENAGYIEITQDIEGVIQGALFAGRDVENEGTITADGNSSGGYIGFVADQNVTIGEGGTISVGRATVSLTGGSVMMEPDAYISGGSVLAEATAGDAIVYGDIDVSSDDGQGGSVQVLGQRVGLVGNATIDASGATGGGTVNVGGNFQGKGDLQNARETFVGAGAVITADALTDGDGGTVIVWADQTTNYQGTIIADGGAQGGKGGFAEVSGKEQLTFDGAVHLLGTDGNGTLLLDPVDIEFNPGTFDGQDGTQVNSGTDEDNFLSNDDDDLQGDGTIAVDETGEGTNPFRIFESELEGLAAAVGNIDLTASGAITDNGAISLALGAGTNLTLQAESITLDETDFTTVAAVDFTATAGAITVDSITASGSVDLNATGGIITVSGGETVDAGANTITLISDDFDVAGNVTTTGDVDLRRQTAGAFGLGTGGLLDDAELGRITAENLLIGNGANVDDIQVDNVSNTTVSGKVTLASTATIDFVNNPSTFTNAELQAFAATMLSNSVLLTVGGNAELLSSGAIAVDSIAASGSVKLDATGDVTISGDVMSTGDLSIDGDTIGILTSAMTSSGAVLR